MDLSRLNDLVGAHNTLYIAFSGGADSMCLAHHLGINPKRDPRAKIICLHVDHGLDPRSSERALAAEQLANGLGLPCIIETMQLGGGQNIEANARSARYAFFKQTLQAGDVLVTAHHKDDVAETLMLRMLRGAGIAGLSGIAANQRFGQGHLIRPLLDWSRAQIVDYLKTRELQWVEDPTNEVMSIDRNFIRHEIMPQLTKRFPGALEALNRSATLNRQGAELLAHVVAERVARDERDHQRLCIAEWTKKPPFEKAEIIRSWCLSKSTAPPPGKPLESFVSQIASANPDRLPTLTWDGGVIHCYRNHLWLSQPNCPNDRFSGQTNGHKDQLAYDIEWDGAKALVLPNGLGTLRLNSEKLALKSTSSIAFRVASKRPEEQILLGLPARPYRTKKLLSEAHIPPWQRDGWPRLWLDGTLIACGARWQATELNNALTWETACFGAQPNAAGIS